MTKHQMRDGQIDTTVNELKKNMVILTLMIIGAPIPKKYKQVSMTSALVDAATVFAKVCPLHPMPYQ